MGKLAIGLILALALSLAVAYPACAVPPAGGDTGQLLIFGEYGMDIDAYEAPIFGVGFVPCEGLSLGLEVQAATYGTAYGLFANIAAGSFTAGAEFLSQKPGSDTWLSFEGAYRLGPDAFHLDLGGGVIFTEGLILPYFEGVLGAGISNDFSLYGGLRYTTQIDVLNYELGLACYL